MDLNQYKKICESCNHILIASNARVECMAIPWLHILRFHPWYVKNHEIIFEAKLIPRSIDAIILYFRELLYFGRFLLRLIHSIRKKYSHFKNIVRDVDYLFLSHLTNPLDLSSQKDFYFGTCPSKLIADGKTVLIIYINHTNLSSYQLENFLANSPIPRVILKDILPIAAEFQIWSRTKKESIRLRQLANHEKDQYKKKILKRVAFEAISDGTKTSIRIGMSIYDIIKNTNAKKLITTHEGFSWERICYFYARKANINIKRFGYIHSAFFPYQNSVLGTFGLDYDPEQLLVAGEQLKILVEKSVSKNTSNIKILGSPRRMDIGTVNKGNACLVLPEGIVSECIVIFNFSLDCAISMPDITFIWRLHPVIVWSKIIRVSPRFKKLPNNIILSMSSLEEDINKSKWALYRGSTAIISAVSNDVIPIYYAADQLLIDPLYEVVNKKNSVKTVPEFKKIISYIKREEKIINYAKNYFSPENHKVLET